MNALSNLSYDNSIQEEKDSLGGGRSLFESGVYLATIKLAYLEKASSGALGVNLTADIDGQEYKETLWVTSGDAKGNKNFYVDTRSGEKRYLAGFLQADGISLLSTGKSISEQATERKIVKVYNYVEKKELPTEVDVLVDMLGKQIQLAILKEITFKREKQDDNSYKETTDTQESNVIDKVFHANHGKTVAECRAQVEKAEFIEEWKAKWAGVAKDKTKGKTPNGSGTGTPGVPHAAAATAKSTTSLFK